MLLNSQCMRIDHSCLMTCLIRHDLVESSHDLGLPPPGRWTHRLTDVLGLPIVRELEPVQVLETAHRGCYLEIDGYTAIDLR